jgi:ubiquinone/menaquinone biosynthesis C-methylase UbiE
MAKASVGHFLVGMGGLAILRHWLGAPDVAAARVDELARLFAEPDSPPLALRLDVPSEDVQSGYARWARAYDTAANPLIRVEEPAVRALVDALPPGIALDAACGTGRHARYLHARGHRLIGVDASAAMLEVAREALPEADLRLGDLTALPLETASVDLVVYSLALTHCEDLGPPIAELARVVRPGGRLVVSDFHPLQLMIGGSAFFVDAGGRAGHVRSHAHAHEDYFTAFAAASLAVQRCIEPRLDEEAVAMASGGLMRLAPEIFRGALLGLPEALVWELART